MVKGERSIVAGVADRRKVRCGRDTPNPTAHARRVARTGEEEGCGKKRGWGLLSYGSRSVCEPRPRRGGKRERW